MSEALWTDPAEAELEAYLDHLAEYDIRTAQPAGRELRALADQTARLPGLARAAQWRGLRVRSAVDWHKLLIFSISEEAVTVVALLDMRQDLSRVRL